MVDSTTETPISSDDDTAIYLTEVAPESLVHTHRVGRMLLHVGWIQEIYNDRLKARIEEHLATLDDVFADEDAAFKESGRTATLTIDGYDTWVDVAYADEVASGFASTVAVLAVIAELVLAILYGVSHSFLAGLGFSPSYSAPPWASSSPPLSPTMCSARIYRG
ncbi:MAG: hypothetical protein AUI14_12940 [Actinobacteria bacterium 13_2_20CM_2_71_6]|nr:MAG: hypothetical protein AUI14_12940 [Actinobacteria bacterium 13_2_20CM_2_71_6]